jgi:hypothetical protein
VVLQCPILGKLIKLFTISLESEAIGKVLATNAWVSDSVVRVEYIINDMSCTYRTFVGCAEAITVLT